MKTLTSPLSSLPKSGRKQRCCRFRLVRREFSVKGEDLERAVIPGSDQGVLRSSVESDSYLSKLVKYVPVEGIAPFLPLATMANDSVIRLWITFVVALIVGLALIGAQVVGAEQRPRVWFWPFVIVSFGAWSVGASQEFREMLGVSQSAGSWFLGLAAGALPALDTGLEKILSRG